MYQPNFCFLPPTLLVACVCFAGVMAPVPQASGEEIVEQLELLRRQALLEEARELMAQGVRQLDGNQYDLALEAFAGARELLPVAPATQSLRDEATARYAEAALGHAAKLLAAGDPEAAKALVSRVLDKDVAPENPKALEMLAQINDPVRHNPAMNAAHTEKVNEVVRLLGMADGAFQLGQFDRADGFYKQVLAIDPTNTRSRHGLERVAVVKSDAYRAGYDHLRAELLAEVDEQWELKVAPSELPDEAFDDGFDEAASHISVADKLERIVIPRIAMDQVSLEEAVDFLRAVTIREDKLSADEQSKGINFTINLGSEDETSRIMNQRIDLQLRNVPVEEVLKHVTRMTRTSFKVDDYAVIIMPYGSAAGELITRTYRVPPDLLSKLGSGGTAPASDDPFSDSGNQGGLLTKRLSVTELLTSKGVSFPDGAVASYTPGAAMLRIVNTPANHDLISQIVEVARNTDPVMVSVQVTMIQTEQNNLRELGFDWLMTPLKPNASLVAAGGTTGAGSPRTAADFSNTIGLPADPTATVNSGMLTSGLRSGSYAIGGNSIDNLVLNQQGGFQSTRVAPGLLSLTGVFSDGQAQLIMRGLDQKKGVDIMANPSLVTRSGQSAKISLVREFIYPTEYDPPEISSGGGGVGRVPVVPANPTAFEMRELGLTLEVLPVVDNDKTYIDLTLNPSVVEFDGFVNYGSPISDSVVGLTGQSEPVIVSENSILMPIFDVQRTTSQLTIADGATITFGGLLSQNIQSIEDKVPVLGDVPMLGRLFRTQAYAPMSKAVVFMVRVELMDPTGRLYREDPSL